jgi:hypothetical protein
MVDARGHGQSAAPEQGYSVTIMHRTQQTLLPHLTCTVRCPRPLHGWGNGSGISGCYPELPGAILVEDAGAFGMKSPTPASDSRALEAEGGQQEAERQRAQEEEPAQKERQARMQAWIASLQDKTREELIAQQRPRRLTGPMMSWGHGRTRSCGSARMFSIGVMQHRSTGRPSSGELPALHCS